MKVVWIWKFIYGLDVVPSDERPMDMHCDQSGAIIIANEPGVQKAPNTLVDRFTTFDRLSK